jgi:hypothetical protein
MEKLRFFYSPVGDTNVNDYTFNHIEILLDTLDDILEEDGRAFVLITNEGVYGKYPDIYVSDLPDNINRQIIMLTRSNSLNEIDGEVIIAIHECENLFEAYEYCIDLLT